MIKEALKTYLVTTPAFYVNNLPHVGHIYSIILASYISSLLGLPIISGTDLHGKKMELTAKNHKMTPEDYTRIATKPFFNIFQLFLKSEFYQYNHTETSIHKKVISDYFPRLVSNSCKEGFYEGFYNVQDEEFTKVKTESTVYMKERTLFLLIKKYKGQLKQLYKNRKINIYPSFYKKNIFNSLDEIDQLSILRKVKWGIESGIKNRTIHVWVDALTYYLSSAININNRIDQYNFIHVIGKDIITFHAIYWPIILISYGIDFSIQLVVTGWLLANQEKISKRLNNNPFDYNELEKCNNGILSVYCLTRNIGYDSNISKEEIELTYKNLSNVIGNCIHRIIILAMNYNLSTFYRRNSTRLISINNFNRMITFANVINKLLNSSLLRRNKIIISTLLTPIAYLFSSYLAISVDKTYLYHTLVFKHLSKERILILDPRKFGIKPT